MDSTTLDNVKFESNLFGSIGADVFTGPNMIDFGSVFDDFGAKLLENAAVVGTVIGILILYIPFALLCRRLDGKDKNKVTLVQIFKHKY